MKTATVPKASDFESAAQSVCETTSEALCAMRKEADELLARASDCIRKHPLAAAAGLLAAGIVVGSVIISRRQDPISEQVGDRLDDAADSICSTFNRLFNNLKFW